MNTLFSWLALGIPTVVVIVLLSAFYAIPVMLLWNWLMPTIFGLKTIGLFKALGLSVLCSLLFKSPSSSNNS